MSPDESPKPHKSKRTLYIAAIIAAALGLVCMITLIICSILLLHQNQQLLSVLNPEDTTQDSEDQPTQEDGVTIAEEYVIESTLPISDAYKSGDTSSLSDKEKETLTMASDVLSSIITDDMTDYEKEKAVYDWMTANLSQDAGMLTVVTSTTEDCDNPYGTLKYHNAVCVGYATTFRLFMQMLDIPCMVVHNTEAYHSWDLVQIDGDWYHTDIYSDVGAGNYVHFNCNDTMQMQSQNWDTSYFPAATSLTYNIAYQNAEVLTDIYSLPQLMRDALDEEAGMLAVKLSADTTDEELAVFYSMYYTLEDTLNLSDNMYVYGSLYETDDGWLYVATIEEYDIEYTDFGISEEEQAKIEDAINDAFEDMGISSDSYAYNW